MIYGDARIRHYGTARDDRVDTGAQVGRAGSRVKIEGESRIDIGYDGPTNVHSAARRAPFLDLRFARSRERKRDEISNYGTSNLCDRPRT